LNRLEAQVLPHDLRRDQDDRGAVAIGFIEAIDEVETAGAAGAGARRETTGEQRFGPCGEGAGLFVPHMDPIDLAAIDGVGDPVQRVSDDAVTVLHAGCLQCFDQYIGYSFAHSGTSHVSCHVYKLTSRHGDLQEGELDGAQPRDAKKTYRMPRQDLPDAQFDDLECGDLFHDGRSRCRYG
jgi:hypothetical protein